MPSEDSAAVTEASPRERPTSTAVTATPEPAWRRLLVNQTSILVVVFLVMVAFFSVLNPRFFSTAAFGNILQDWAPIMLLAIGQTYVIITGGIDLSVGSTLGFSGILCAEVIRALNLGGHPAWLSVLAGIVAGGLTGLVIGAVNALLVTRIRLVPFVATLATMGAVAGLNLVVSGGVQIADGPDSVVLIGNTTYLGLFTAPVLVVVLLAVIATLYLHRTRFGRWTYAVGSNAFAARGAGINTARHLAVVYTLSGLMAGLGGVVVYFRLGAGAPSSGLGNELTAIAAVVIGGCSLSGGVGRMTGTVVGALIITSVLSGLIIIGVQPNWQQVVVGGLIAVAVALQGVGGSVRR